MAKQEIKISALGAISQVKNTDTIPIVTDGRTSKVSVSVLLDSVKYKEDSLGAPTIAGQLLSSDQYGVRSWINAPSGSGGGSGTGLEAINEGDGVGWRLVGRDPAEYDGLGKNAIDFSYTTFTEGGGKYGAIGTGSFASGVMNLTSSGYHADIISLPTSHSLKFLDKLTPIVVGDIVLLDDNGWDKYEVINVESGSGYERIITFVEDIGRINNTKGLFRDLGGTSYVEGDHNISIGIGAHAEGIRTEAIGEGAHAEGYGTTAQDKYSHAEGYNTTVDGFGSHAEGCYTTATSVGSHAHGYQTEATGFSSHAHGYQTVASGSYSHAQGYYTTASGSRSVVIGIDYAEASAYASIVIGAGGVAVGDGGNDAWDTNGDDGAVNSIVIGKLCSSYNANSISIGYATRTDAKKSVALGYGCMTGSPNEQWGYGSVAIGYNTNTRQNKAVAIGQYNIGIKDTPSDIALEIGIGANNNNRANAFEAYKNGDLIAPNLTLDGSSNVKTLVTKEYADSLSGGGGELVKDGVGYRLNGVNTGTLGTNALDFSTGGKAEGISSIAIGTYAYATGHGSKAVNLSTEDYYTTTASGQYSTAIGMYATASGNFSTAVNTTDEYSTVVSGKCSTAIGYENLVDTDYSSASGVYNTIDGNSHYSDVIGQSNEITDSKYSEARGYENTFWHSTYSSAIGYSNTLGAEKTTQKFSHASGYDNEVQGSYSTSTGQYSTVVGHFSSASGYNTTVTGNYSFGAGNYINLTGDYKTVFGRYNVDKSDSIFEIGVGTADKSRENAFDVYSDGTAMLEYAHPAEITNRGKLPFHNNRVIPTVEWLLSPEFGNSLPIEDPQINGQLWNDNNIVTVSVVTPP